MTSPLVVVIGTEFQ